MQTRSATKRAAEESEKGVPAKLKAGTKRPATVTPSPKERPSRKRAKAAKKSNRVLVQQDPEILPHGLGNIHFKSVTNQETQVNEHTFNSIENTAKSNEKQGIVKEDDEKEDISASKWPARLQSLAEQTSQFLLPTKDEAHKEVSQVPIKEEQGQVNSPNVADASVHKEKRVPKRTKDNPYGLMPGRTPFPDRIAPTAEQCQEVHNILTELHGDFKSPKKIPPPSTEIAGCGEVPDLVDAMIRTLISGHTAMANANMAIQDVITTYGQLDKDGIGAGSIDWNRVRLSSEGDVMMAIKKAGLGVTKSKDIKKILDMVHEENRLRRAAYLKEKETGEPADVTGATELTQGQKDHQVLKVESDILTLDHIRGMTPDEAMLEFTKYPGIGVKTASCLILFCLQQPSFAVDTHVWRISKWLGWVPQNASRDDTYMHCELRVPAHLKYGLHQLFIQHGKSCGRCRGNTVEGTAEWDNAACPLEHLLDRFDKRKTKAQPKKTVRVKKRKTAEMEEGSGQLVETTNEELTVEAAGDDGNEDRSTSLTSGKEDSDDEAVLDDNSRTGWRKTTRISIKTNNIALSTNQTGLVDELKNSVAEVTPGKAEATTELVIELARQPNDKIWVGSNQSDPHESAANVDV